MVYYTYQGFQVIISKVRCASLPVGCFYLTNSAEQVKMLHSVAFHLGFHNFSQSPLSLRVSSIHRVKVCNA